MPQFRDPKLGKITQDDYYRIVYDDLQKEAGRPRISYRKKRADTAQAMRLEQGLEFTIEWTQP